MARGRLFVYTDGSCYYKDKKGGWGFVVYKNHKVIYRANGHCAETSTMRMEMTAMLKALQWLDTVPFKKGVIIRTDNKTVQQGLSTWIYKWKARGWATSGGTTVKNQDLWESMYPYLNDYPLKIQWVKGHSGEYGNEEADRLAGLGRKNIIIKTIKRKKK